MKCPKCGYTSFDYLDGCRKCGADLRDARSHLQIIAVAPEERAPVFGTDTAAREASPSAFAAAPTAFDREPPPDFGRDEGSNDELLADLNFDQSFEDMVEPTSYGAPSAGAPAKPAEDDGLLDLDFGDVFGEKEGKDKA